MKNLKLTVSLFWLLAALLAVNASAGKWELQSDYQMDGTYSPTPIPGSGTALEDSGPANFQLESFEIPTFNSWPAQVTPGSDGTGNALYFDSNDRDTIHAQTFDFSNGFRVELDFKDSGSQTNPYPSVIHFFDGTSSKARLEARPSGGVGDITAFYFFIGGDYCSVSGSWNDGQWHSVVIEYDPLSQGSEIYLEVDGVSATASGAVAAQISDPIMKLGQRYESSGSGDRGFNGSLDNVKLYKRNYEWLQYSSYDFEGTYDATAGTGEALQDSGPIGQNDLRGIDGTWNVDEAPSQVDGSDPNSTTDNAFLFETTADGSGGYYTEGVEFPFDMDCSDGFKLEYDFSAGLVEADSVYIEMLFGIGAGNFWGIQCYSPDGASILERLKLRFGGTDTANIYGELPNRFSDNQWRHVTAGYLGTSRTWVSVDDEVEYKDASFSSGNPSRVLLARTTSGNIRYAFQGKLDNLKLYYLKQAELTNPTGGETLFQNQIVELTWDPLASGDIAIYYSDDNGDTWNIVEGLTANDGSYYWTVPEITSTQCLIKLTSTNKDSQVYSTSGQFTIQESIPADINNDGFVNVIDLQMLAEDWLECGNPFGCN
jgi:hypothetical protein